ELDQLETIFDHCVDERAASMVLLTGASGVGKSRLGHELLRRLEARGQPLELWIVQADALYATTPFGLLVHLLRRTWGLSADEPIEAQQDKIRARVAHRLGSGGARVAEVLGQLFSAPVEGGRSGPRHIPASLEQLAEAVASLLRAECAAQPVVLVL